MGGKISPPKQKFIKMMKKRIFEILCDPSEGDIASKSFNENKTGIQKVE